MKLTQIKGIGPKKAELLQEMGIDSVEKLWAYLPNYYENRSILTSLVTALDGEKQYFQLEITGQVKTYFVRRNMTITRVSAKDETAKVDLIWYNDRFSPQRLEKGQTYKFFGSYNKEKNSMPNPIFCDINEDMIGGIYPIYSVIRGLSKKDFIKFKDRMFENLREINDYLPEEILDYFDVVSLDSMFRIFHKPKTYFDLINAKRSFALRQMLIDKLANYMTKKEDDSFIKFELIDLQKPLSVLDFKLTHGQTTALKEIEKDMISTKRMNRIIIGDVGSGKTIVAVMSAYIAIKNGYQVAFMAPTEILAIQHYENYKKYLKAFSIESRLLIGSTSNPDREIILESLERGHIDIVFGTHTLFQNKVEFKRLGLVITDEQQRFGVYQRKLISQKGDSPDLLLLSATPIPRTLALTMYKDLDISIIESLPSGRKKIESYLVTNSYEKRFVRFAEKQMQEGRQVYVVCPRVTDDEELDINSVESIYKRYKKYFQGKFLVDILHGRLSPEEKAKKQEDFASGKIDILIATSIIEVGIDVKNASLMIIYDANYFGLSQLHQLRGRIGRGIHQSYCIFVASSDKVDDEKLKFIESCQDGFEISKKDLELRGAGDRLGIYQSGFTEDSPMDIYDQSLVEKSNSIVEKLINENQLEQNQALRSEVENRLLAYEKVILN